MGHCLRLTVIVPAFNEEAYLAPTLDSVHAAAQRLRSRSRVDIETIVVDNNSNDETATVARNRGATVIHEPVQGIGRARNTGARHATGDVLVFVDADVIVPRTFPGRSACRDGDPKCIGGADLDGYTFAGTAGLAFAADLLVTGAGFKYPDTVRTTLAPTDAASGESSDK